MCNQVQNKRTPTAIALALGILMVTFATPALAAAPPVSVIATSVSGSNVYVTVRNNTLLPQIRTVGVQVVLGDTAVWSYAPVTLLPFQTATVRAGFVGTVSAVISCGMSDDGNPM